MKCGTPGKKKKWICKAMLGVTDDPAETPRKAVLGSEHLITGRVPTNGVECWEERYKSDGGRETGFMEDD